MRTSEKPLVLAADDTPDVLYVIRRALENTYRIELVDNGTEALELAKRLQPEVIVSDVYMPEMSGLDLVEALKSTPETQSIPVILLTGDQQAPR